jgi:hypothetical protein
MVVAIAALAGACGDDSTSPNEEQHTIADYVASVSVDSTPGVIQTNAIPRPITGGPAITTDGQGTIVNGGTTRVSVTSPTPFQNIFVAGSLPISPLFVPVSNYFEIPLPTAVTSAELLITFPQALASNDFTLHISAADPQGRVGMPFDRSYHAIVVGAGDIQVTVAWDTDADVDLHVVDPEGTEIYWANRTSPSGGELDLDSNAACAGDNVRNENITWPLGTAPQGDYTVRVDYWANCDASLTNYTVVVHNQGVNEIHYGTFSGSGDAGGIGSGDEITTFTRTVGPPPAPSRPHQNLPVGPTSKQVIP